MLVTELLTNENITFAVVDTAQIRFDPMFRELCQKNTCGFYGACWMCPPDVGSIDDWIAKARAYDRAFVFQTVREIEDSFDIEGMRHAARAHNRLIVRLRHAAEEAGVENLLLGAGACGGCEECAKKRNEPCVHPERAVVPIEAAGVDVTQLATLTGLPYINGKNTVTYFGLLLYRGEISL